MLDKWTTELAITVQKLFDAINDGELPCSKWSREAARRTNGIPAYEDLSGTIALTLNGELFFYNSEEETVEPVIEQIWKDVALASLVRTYPDLQNILPLPPANSASCLNCTGSGWMNGGRLFCIKCRGRGWLA